MTTTLKPNPDGGITIPKELLGDVEPGMTFHFKREGRTLRLEPASRKLHEIEDPEERVQAVETFMNRIAHKTGVQWPESYNARDDIYD